MAKADVVLVGFWEGLYTHSLYPRFIEYFNTLFADVADRYTHIFVYSVFGDDIPPPTRAPTNLYVQFSGEAHYHNPNWFDINLIPHKSAPAIIPHTLAGMDLTIHQTWDKVGARRDAEQRIPSKFCAFIVSNPGPVERRRFFNMLNVRKPIDSWGAFQNTMRGERPPAEQGTPAYFEFLGAYKFMLCFEGSSADYYLTEKLINAYAGGCIPIYWGCPQVAEILNPRAFLHLKEPTTEAMAELIEQILALDADDAAYRAMRAEPLFSDGIVPDIMNTTHLAKTIAVAIKS